MKKYYPEGKLLHTEANKSYTECLDGLKKAFLKGEILESIAISSDSSHNLYLDIPFAKVIMKREDVALGVKEGNVREIAIISRVGKPVCFKIVDILENDLGTTVYVSRAKAQEEAQDNFIKNLVSGDILQAKVTHLEPFGAFVDCACGIISLIGIENISVSRINHPSDRFFVGQDIFAIFTGILQDKIHLTHKELLGTWEQNAKRLNPLETITGIVRSVEPYGVFVELFPNLSGLAEHKDGVFEGDTVSVHIKSINFSKMKIKLSIIGKVEPILKTLDYFIETDRINVFKYSPDECSVKNIIREF